MTGAVVLSVRAVPGARRDEVRYDVWARAWVVAVRAPARGGQANRAILGLLADRLGVPSADLDWVGGTTSRRKRVAVRGLPPAEIERRLAASGSAPR